jgi:hypothetical protein
MRAPVSICRGQRSGRVPRVPARRIPAVPAKWAAGRRPKRREDFFDLGMLYRLAGTVLGFEGGAA